MSGEVGIDVVIGASDREGHEVEESSETVASTTTPKDPQQNETAALPTVDGLPGHVKADKCGQCSLSDPKVETLGAQRDTKRSRTAPLETLEVTGNLVDLLQRVDGQLANMSQRYRKLESLQELPNQMAIALNCLTEIQKEIAKLIERQDDARDPPMIYTSTGMTSCEVQPLSSPGSPKNKKGTPFGRVISATPWGSEGPQSFRSQHAPPRRLPKTGSSRCSITSSASGSGCASEWDRNLKTLNEKKAGGILMRPSCNSSTTSIATATTGGVYVSHRTSLASQPVSISEASVSEASETPPSQRGHPGMGLHRVTDQSETNSDKHDFLSPVPKSGGATTPVQRNTQMSGSSASFILRMKNKLSARGSSVAARPSSMIFSLASTGPEQWRTLTRTSVFSQIARPMGLQSYVMKPNSHKRLVWDMAVIINTVLVGILLPLMLVYFDRAFSPSFDDPLFWMTDTLWLLDVLMNFFTGYNEHGQSVMEPRRISIAYAKRLLLVDVLSSVPLALVRRDSTWFLVVCSFKVPRVLQLGIRMHRLRVEVRSGIASGVMLPTYITLVICLAANVLACGWRMGLRADMDRAGTPDFELGLPWEDMYLTDLYWVIMTTTTIGYGDVGPLGNVGRLYAIGVMLLGSACFSAIISGFTHVTSSFFHNPIETRVAELTRFMRQRHVPQALQRRVQHNLRVHLHYRRSTAMDPELLTLLSPAMQRELSLCLLSNTVLHFPLFKNAPRTFVAELAQAHRWEQVLAGDLVAEEGHIVQEVVFIIHGCIRVWGTGGPDMHQLDAAVDAQPQDLDEHDFGARTQDLKAGDSDGFEILAGAWFGQSCLFFPERIYTASMVALTSCELALLAAQAYFKIVQQYPRLWEQHKSLEFQIKCGELDVRDIAYKEPRRKVERVTTTASLFRQTKMATRSLEQWNFWRPWRLIPSLPIGFTFSESAVAPQVIGEGSPEGT